MVQKSEIQRAQRSNKFNLARNFQSRSKFLISLENFNFNLDVSISPQKKIGPRWVARSRISFSLEIFNLARNLECFLIFGRSGKLERNAGAHGRELWGKFSKRWGETLEKQSRKIRGRNMREEFAEKFAGNSPEIRQPRKKKKKLHPNPLCRPSVSNAVKYSLRL